MHLFFDWTFLINNQDDAEDDCEEEEEKGRHEEAHNMLTHNGKSVGDLQLQRCSGVGKTEIFFVKKWTHFVFSSLDARVQDSLHTHTLTNHWNLGYGNNGNMIKIRREKTSARVITIESVFISLCCFSFVRFDRSSIESISSYETTLFGHDQSNGISKTQWKYENNLLINNWLQLLINPKRNGCFSRSIRVFIPTQRENNNGQTKWKQCTVSHYIWPFGLWCSLLCFRPYRFMHKQYSQFHLSSDQKQKMHRRFVRSVIKRGSSTFGSYISSHFQIVQLSLKGVLLLAVIVWYVMCGCRHQLTACRANGNETKQKTHIYVWLEKMNLFR